MMMATEPPPGGEAQAAESVDDGLKAPKADGFAKGKAIA
jgi:hypothetical protein